MKIKKILKRGLIGLLLLATIVLAARLVFGWIETGRLNKAVASLKDRGVPLTIKDLAPSCPDADNAARPWKAAEELIVFDKQDLPLFNKVLEEFQKGNSIGAEDTAAMKALIKKNEEPLRLFAEAAGKTCFWLGDTEAKSFARRAPKYVSMLRAEKLTVLQAYFSAEDGDVLKALDQLRVAYKFQERLSGESSLMNGLIVIAQSKIALFGYRRVIQGRPVPPDVLAALIKSFQPSAWRERFARAIRGERVFFLEVGQEIVRQNPFSRGERILGGGLFKRIYYWLISPWGRRDIRARLRMFDDLESLAHRPFYQARDFFDSNRSGGARMKWHQYVSDLAYPYFLTAYMKAGILEAILQTARTGLACRIYKSQNGRYPEDLAALIPAILPEIPIDPFSGKPLIYKKSGAGFIVYSVGTNQKDEGGRESWIVNQLPMEKDDDWNWKEDK